MGNTGHVAYIKEMKNEYRIVVRNLKDRDHLGNIGKDKRISLKWILEKQAQGKNWIYLAPVQDVAKMTLNFRVPQKVGKVLNIWATTNISGNYVPWGEWGLVRESKSMSMGWPPVAWRAFSMYRCRENKFQTFLLESDRSFVIKVNHTYPLFRAFNVGWDRVKQIQDFPPKQCQW